MSGLKALIRQIFATVLSFIIVVGTMDLSAFTVLAEEIGTDYGTLLEEGSCGYGNDSIVWKIYDSGADEDEGLETGDTLVFSGSGLMIDFEDGVPWEIYALDITKVVIEDEVTTIGAYTFQGCKNLVTVQMSSNITSIGASAFCNCSSLTEITIPDKVTSLGDNVFEGCSSLTGITLPSSVTGIGNNAFEDCSKLTNVAMSNYVTQIGEGAFLNCNSLTDISLPSGITSLSNSIFSGCRKLSNITIPDNVTSIGSSAFRNCTGLESISIPGSVTYIGELAFYNCSNLTGVSNLGSISEIRDKVFMNCKKLTDVTIPESVTSIGEHAFENCLSLTTITIPSNVTSIGLCALYGCSSLSNIVIQGSITAIDDYAFVNCTGLTSITLPDTIKRIGISAFDGCSNLAELTIPAEVTEIGSWAFSGCSSLTHITIPAKVTSISDYMFYNCSSLAEVTIPSTITSIGKYAFSGCSNLTGFTLPNEVTAIAEGTFAGCSQLATIYIPKTITAIGENAFLNNSIDQKIYLESTAVFGNATSVGNSSAAPILPYKIAYKRGETDVTIAEVYADGEQSFAFTEEILEEIGGILYDVETKQNVTAETRLENINAHVVYGRIPLVITGHPQGAVVTYNATQKEQLTVTVDADAGAQVNYQWQVAVVSDNIVGDYTDVAGATAATHFVPDGMDIGTYSYRCVVSCDGETLISNEARVIVNSMALTISDVTIEDKIFDDTADASVESVTFYKNGNPGDTMTLTKDIDYTAIAFFDEKAAGSGREVSVTITLIGKAAENYTLADNEYTVTDLVIEKADVLTKEPITKSYLYSNSSADSINLAELLPENCGTALYGEPIVENLTYQVMPALTDGILSYTLESGSVGDTGTIKVVVTTQNYKDITFTIHISLVEQLKVALQEDSSVTLKNNVLTYGEPLSKLVFNEAVFVEEGRTESIEGALSWKNPSAIYEVGAYDAEWIFTPKDERYLPLEGVLEVIVEKADCEICNLNSPDGYEVVYTYDGEPILQPKAEQFTHDNTDQAGELTFSFYQGDYTVQDAILSEDNKLGEMPKDAGIYTLVVALAETDNFNKSEARVKIEIKKKAITVTAEDAQRPYNEENPAFVYKIPEDALAGDDTKTDLHIELTTEAVQTSNVGTYAITGASTSVNYEVTVIPAVLTIVQAVPRVIVAEENISYTKTFGDAPFEILASTDGDGALTYTLKDGKTLEGERKDIARILTVSEEGVATINGSGIVTVLISTKETDNYKAAENVAVTVQINRHDGFMVEAIPDVTYTGSAIRPEPRVYDGNNEVLLVKGRDYTLTYKNNKNASTQVTDVSKLPTVIIKGKGNYSKKISVTFNILQKDITAEDVIANDIVVEANNKIQKKVPVITYNKKKLKGVRKADNGQTVTKNKDFIYSYPALLNEQTKGTAFKQPGTYEILVEGIGNFTGSTKVYLTITAKGYSIKKATIQKIPAQNMEDYNGQPVVLSSDLLVVTAKIDGRKETLVEGIDFTTQYTANDKAGKATVTITGIGNFEGTKSATFKINGIPINKVTVPKLQDKTYNGEEQYQNLTLTFPIVENGEVKERELTPKKDYTLTYSKNIDAGTATIRIKGIGMYTGTMKKTFKILPYDFMGETDAKGNVKEGSPLSETNGLLKKADGELHVKFMKGGAKPAVELYFGDTLLEAKKDYTVTYSNNKTVTKEGQTKLPTITIKGKKNFKGVITKIFTIDAKDLDDADSPVTMTVNDKAVSKKAGGYISKPVLADKSGKILKVGKDYTQPVYTMEEDGKTVILDKKSKVAAGSVITVTVSGMGDYTDKTISATYRITPKNFKNIKAKNIQKIYTGWTITLKKSDFYNEDGTSKITFGKGKNKVYLEYGVDFEIVKGSYKKNIKKGTASVTLRGLGEYGGVKTIKFKITTRELVKK